MPARRFAILLLFSFFPASLALAQSPGVYAITGGTVHPASGPEIANGVVVVRGGLVESVGAGIAVPPDAAVIDVHGYHVYPALIDAQTSAGFPAPRTPTRRRRGSAPRSAASEPPLPETSPAFVAARNVRLTGEEGDAFRAAGIATILTAPAFGIFNGSSAIMNLGPDSPEREIVLSPAAMQVSFNPRPSWTFPDSLMGVMAYFRQTVLDAQQYSAAHAIYEKNPAGLKRPETNESLAAMQPVLAGSEPVVFVADTELMMRRAIALGREFGLRFILSGARQAYRMPDDLRAAGIPLLVSVKWPVPPTAEDDRADQPLRVIRDRMLEPTTPSVLAKSGVRFALVTGPGKAGEFLDGIRTAIENGLSADDALRATTLWPAQIFGIDRQLGSLDRGKIANVLVTDKPLFERGAAVKRLFVDGREVRLSPIEKKRGSESTSSPIDGTWSVSVRSAQGEVAMRLTLHVEDGRVSGTYSGEKGSGDVRGGTFDGSTIEFTLGVQGQQENESGDWVFHGTVASGSMQGDVTTNAGTFAFTGSKPR